jgi:protein subunit release factor A
VAEAEAALALAKKAAAKELEALLDGEADGNDTFLEINAGAGGTESCDWARCWRGCMSAGPKSTATRSNCNR